MLIKKVSQKFKILIIPLFRAKMANMIDWNKIKNKIFTIKNFFYEFFIDF